MAIALLTLAELHARAAAVYEDALSAIEAEDKTVEEIVAEEHDHRRAAGENDHDPREFES